MYLAPKAEHSVTYAIYVLYIQDSFCKKNVNIIPVTYLNSHASDVHATSSLGHHLYLDVFLYSTGIFCFLVLKLKIQQDTELLY